MHGRAVPVCPPAERGFGGTFMNLGTPVTKWIAAAFALLALVSIATVAAQSPATPAPARAVAPPAGKPAVSTPAAPRASQVDPAGIEKQKALVTEYCVTCHNDRTKTAN